MSVEADVTVRGDNSSSVPMDMSAVTTVDIFRNENDEEAPNGTREYKGSPPDNYDETTSLYTRTPHQSAE